ncbi:hypothetical protein CMUS01_03730 [Colletotrichum musicola]|uniref:Uncharacterized protein n=1 Tax=Colletotrichum musicola TaxID=2175873 RepID=A0A8H6NR53_9PEZI|nr:hypothetical protein CMUS01_03730 [Colletotrichum musicola]
MRSTTILTAAACLVSSASALRAAANLCFFPGGVQSLDVPCDPKAEVSMCCGSVNACLSNGLCKLEDTSNNTGIAYARGTCSDPTWQSPICPQNCVLNPDTRKNNSAYDFRFNGVQVWQCDSQGFAVPGKFCCESAAEKTRCCSTPAAIFGPLIAATPGNALAVQTLNTAKSSPTPSGSHGAGGSSAEATGPGGAAHGTPAATSVPTMTSKIPASTPAGAGASAPTDPGQATTPSSGEKQGLGTVAMVGMGVGASVGGALLVAVGVMWWMRKERRERGPVELDGSSIHGGGPGGGDISRSNTGRIAYGGMNIGNGTGTVSSMGTGTYVVGGTMRRASSEWDGSPGGLGGSYQMAEIDGKETLVVSEPKGRKKSLYELP